MRMIKDTMGFSSSIDVLLFLVLVSVSAVLLAPAMVGNIQLTGLHDTGVAEHNSQVVMSLQNGRVDDFSYAVAGTQMDFMMNETLGPGAVDSGMYLSCKKLVAGREIEHKIFADLASESVASQFTIYHADRSVRLNLLTDEYRNNVDVQMQDYLERQIGDRPVSISPATSCCMNSGWILKAEISSIELNNISPTLVIRKSTHALSSSFNLLSLNFVFMHCPQYNVIYVPLLSFTNSRVSS